MSQYLELGSSTPDVWDSNLLKFSDYCYQQTYSFGEYSKTKDSKTFRAILVEGGQPLVMAQGLIRSTIFGVRVLVIRGGPIYQFSGNEKADLKNLRTFLQELIKACKRRGNRFYINITINVEHSVAAEIALREAGLRRPFFERDPYLSYVVPICADTNDNMKAFDSKWRNQLRKAESFMPNFSWGNEEEVLSSYVELHNAMCRIKAIRHQALEINDLVKMQLILGDKMHIAIGRKGDTNVCGCVVIVVNRKAYYYYAAANELGRSGYFSNAMVWYLIQQLRKMNVIELDLVGVDPVKNWGGYHFKKGVGGKAIAFVGEWDYGSFSLLKTLLNCVLYWKSRLIFG